MIIFEQFKTDVNQWFTDTFAPDTGTIPLGLTAFITANVASFLQWGVDVLSKFTQLKNDLNTWYQDTFGIKGTVTLGLGAFILQNVADFKKWGEDVKSWFDKLKTDVDAWAMNTFGPKGSLIAGIKTFTQPFKDWWDGLFGPKGSLMGWFNSMSASGGVLATTIAAFRTAGSRMVAGLIEGVRSMWDWAVKIVGEFFADVIGASLSALRIGSPSKVYAKMGTQIVEGLVKGIEGMSSAPVDALSSIYGSMSKSLPSFSTMPSSNVTNIRNVNISMNAAYSTVQSPASVYNDLNAALISAGI